MNAIIALCHFCEEHGPRTLFCTQAFKYAELNLENKQLETIDVIDSIQPQSLSPDSSSFHDKPILNQPNQYSLNLNQNSSNSYSNSENSSSSCKACRAFDKNFHHYISYDSDCNNPSNNSNNICYISQSTPSDSEVFALVRKACLRTLHCEVFEDPIYFDDDKNGSVIGYEFNVKDSEGRGFQKSYSLLIIMKDRIYLQHLWSFLSQQMAIIASNIKLEAQQQYEKEMREKELRDFNSNTSPVSPAASTTIPFQSHTITINSSLTNRGFQRQSSFYKKNTRGLIELTNDPLIFAKLHMWFTWILRNCVSQISEEFIHGPVTEDSQIKKERENSEELISDNITNNGHERTNGFSHITCLKCGADNSDYNCSCNNSLVENSSDNFNHTFNTSNGDLDFEIGNSKKLFNNNNGHSVIDKNQSNDAEIEEMFDDDEVLLNNFQVNNLRQLLKILDKEKFHLIAYNTIVGNQVIVRGKYKNLISSIIRTLEELIPLGCCQSVYYSNEYIKSYQCKLLGLSDKLVKYDLASSKETNLNLFEDLNDYIFFDIQLKPKMANKYVNSCFTLNTKHFSSNSSSFSSQSSIIPTPTTCINEKRFTSNFNDESLLPLTIKILPSPTLQQNNTCDDKSNPKSQSAIPGSLTWLDLIKEKYTISVLYQTNAQIKQIPNILTKMEDYLFNEKLDDKSVSCLIKSTKEEWLNKTKVFYKYSRSQMANSAANITAVYRMLNLEEKDELQLKFWQAGLSNECKMQIRTA